MNADKTKMKAVFSYLRLSAFICGSVLIGCSSPITSGQSSALSGVDLVKMTDDMAMKIAADEQVQQAYATKGPLKVVMLPVENRMRAEVLPPGPSEAFVARVRSLLAKHDPGKFTWIMNRDSFYHLRSKE